MQALHAAAAAAPKNPWPAVWAAASILAKSAPPEVFVLLDAALASAPRHVPALLLRAVAHERSSLFDRALVDAALAARLAPDCAGVLTLTGGLQARLGHVEDAAASFAAATRLDPSAKEFYGRIALAEQQDGAGRCGLEQLDEYIRRHPAAAWAHALRGDTLRAVVGHEEDGVSSLRRAVELEPKTPWIRACLARSQVQTQRSQTGLRNLRTAIAQDPRCGWLHAWLAEAYRKFDRHDEAVPIFRRAISLSPRSAQIHLWLGRVHADRGLWDAAIKEFTLAVRLDCGYGFAYGKRGHALTQLGRHAEALTDFERALKLGSYPDWTRPMRDQSVAVIAAQRRSEAKHRATMIRLHAR